MDFGRELGAAFDGIFAAASKSGSRDPIAYGLPGPKWQFLCYLAETHDVLLHGSGDPNIEVFEPRKSDDVAEFGNRKAVYAASDGLWPIYFAILDRQRFPMTLINSCVRVETEDGQPSEPSYFFSITGEALEKKPYPRGTIYILSRDGFEQQPAIPYRGFRVRPAQWASPSEARPLARIEVDPGDFPFLGQIRGHDDKTTFERARANPDGFPWLDDDDAEIASPGGG